MKNQAAHGRRPDLYLGVSASALDAGAFSRVEEPRDDDCQHREGDEDVEGWSDVLEVGQVVKAEIIKMDLDSKKIGLSISKVKRDAEKNEFRSYMGSKKSHLSQNLSEQLESLEK